jgi:ferredoxin
MTTMSYRVEIDQELCISSGKCVGDAPTVFAFDDDELAVVIGPDHSLDKQRLLRIARNCPGQAVIIRDETGSVIDL